MPLSSGKSKAAFSHNVEVEIAAGKPKKQAVAIAYHKQRGDADPEIELEKAVEAGESEAAHQKRALAELDIETEDEDDCALDSARATSPRIAMDRAPSKRYRDINGWLHVKDCNITKANICPYLGKEIPEFETLGLDPERLYFLYRDAAALEAAAFTFERIPLMMVHIAVTADQPNKSKIIGAVSNVRWKAPYLVADLTVWDGEGIALIETGTQEELSPGYHYEPVMNSGVLNGESFDGRMTKIAANHLAIVDIGRTGPDVVVNDAALKK